MVIVEELAEQKTVNMLDSIETGDVVRIIETKYEHHSAHVGKIGIVTYKSTHPDNNYVNVEFPDESWNGVVRHMASQNIPIEKGYKVSKETVGSLLYSHLKILFMYNNLRDNANTAIDTIGNRLISESNDRNWCNEFDEIVDSVNNEIVPLGFSLPVREREFEVTWEEVYTVRVARSATYIARDEEEAISIASEDWECSADDIVAAVEADNYEHVESDNYEANSLS